MKNQRFHDWALYAIFYYHTFLSETCAGCYFPNGTDRNAFEVTVIYQPCDPGDADSMCCALNRQDPDKCRSDGLCSSLFDGNIWREGCTDRSWKSSKCLKLCDAGIGQYIEGETIQLADHDATVTPCGDGSYCCGNGTAAQTCCDKKNGVFLSNGETTSINPSSTLSSSPTTSLPSSRTSVATTQTPNSSKNNTGAIVGGVIGGIIILLLIVGIILILTRRSQHAGSEPKIPHEVSGADAKAKLPVPQELSAANVGRELEARQTHELEHREPHP